MLWTLSTITGQLLKRYSLSSVALVSVGSLHSVLELFTTLTLHANFIDYMFYSSYGLLRVYKLEYFDFFFVLNLVLCLFLNYKCVMLVVEMIVTVCPDGWK